MRLSGCPLASVAIARLWLTPARLWLAWLSLLSVTLALLWVQASLAELEARIAGSTLFEGGQVHEVSASPWSAGVYQLAAPYLDASRVSAVFGAETTRILIPADRITAVYTDRGLAQEIDIGIAMASRWFPPAVRTNREPRCTRLGETPTSPTGVRLSFPSGAACQLVAPPTEWSVLERFLEEPLLVIDAPTARDILPRHWESRLGRVLLSLASVDAPPLESDDRFQRLLHQEGWALSAWTPGEPREAGQADRLIEAIHRLTPVGALICALSFFSLLLGQKRLLLREAGLWLSFGADRRWIRAWSLRDMLLQLFVVLVPTVVALAFFFLSQAAHPERHAGTIAYAMGLAAVLVFSGVCFNLLLCGSILRGDPGHLLKELK